MNKEYVIVLYLRISMEDKEVKYGLEKESSSIVGQRKILWEFVKNRQEFRECKVIELCDDGYSGTNFQRPGIQKLFQMTREGAVQCILVKDFSRFGRNYLTVSDYIEQIFPFLGVRFIAVNDCYDSLEYEGKTPGIETAFSNVVYGWYSRDISQKEKSAKKAKAMNGEFLGAFAPIGYKKDINNKNHLIVEEEGAGIVKKIFGLAGAGIPVKEIAGVLNGEGIPTPSAWKRNQKKWNPRWEGIHGEELWDISSITRILRDERYLGKNIYGKRCRTEIGNSRGKKNKKEDWIVVPDCHEAIITKEEFEAAKKILKSYREAGERKHKYGLFQGKLRCGECGYSLAGKKRTKEKREYCCETWRRGGRFKCRKEPIKEKELKEMVEQVLGAYEKIFGKKEDWKNRIRERQKEKTESLKKQMKTCQSACAGFEEQKAAIYEKMVDKQLDRQQYTIIYNKIIEQQKALEEKIRSMEKEVLLLEQKEKSKINWEEVVKTFVECIYVYENGSIKIQWRFLNITSLYFTIRRRGDTDCGNIDQMYRHCFRQ